MVNIKNVAPLNLTDLDFCVIFDALSTSFLDLQILLNIIKIGGKKSSRLCLIQFSPRRYESLKISSNEFEILHFLEINRCYVQKITL